MIHVITLCPKCRKEFKKEGWSFEPFLPIKKDVCDICPLMGITGVLNNEHNRKNKERSQENGS